MVTFKTNPKDEPIEYYGRTIRIFSRNGKQHKDINVYFPFHEDTPLINLLENIACKYSRTIKVFDCIKATDEYEKGSDKDNYSFDQLITILKTIKFTHTETRERVIEEVIVEEVEINDDDYGK